MTDAELAIFLKMPVSQVGALTDRERAAYERLALVELGIKLWLAGEAPRPKGVIICDARSVPAMASTRWYARDSRTIL